MKIVVYIILALTLAITISGMQGAVASPALRVDSTHFNTNTLAGKLASVQSTPGLLVTLSNFLQQEADMSDLAANPTPNTAITPTYVLSSNLDGSTVTAPDSTVFFDNHGNVYFVGLGFDRTAPPNTVTLSKGAFDTSGALHWGPPTFIGQTTAPSTLNDKPWSAVDNNPSSSFYGRIYVSWT